MTELVLSSLSTIRVFFQDRGAVALEVLALRQQLAVLIWSDLVKPHRV